MAATREPPGWYGKLSCLGDFAHRRVTPAWIAACDGWLSRALDAMRRAEGERWLDVYLTAPVLRFAWAPRVIDEAWWFGVLMPSCDNVGRYFPLVVAQSFAEVPTSRVAFAGLDAWFAHVGSAAMETLDDGRASLDAFERRLAQTPSWSFDGSTGSPGLQGWATRYAASVFEGSVVGRSMWSPALGDADVDVTVVDGLPSGDRLFGLFRAAHVRAA